jgi:hypothetical protein
MTTAKPKKNATKGSAVKTIDDGNITLILLPSFQGLSLCTKHDDYAKLKPGFVIGSVRMRSPVAVNTAFAIAGRIGGKAGSLNHKRSEY